MHEGVVGNFHAFPTGVAVHGVVAAGQCGQRTRGMGHVGLEVSNEPAAALGVGVASVGECVNKYVGSAGGVKCGQDPFRVVDVAVDAAVADQSEQVDALAGGSALCQVGKDGVLCKRTVFEGEVDAN